MDCFFAAVEMRDNPELNDIPIAIGGSSDRRGVLCTCNYPARKFGVRSAMSTAMALKLCPDLILIKPHFDKYKEASNTIRAIFKQYTDLVEPLSLDEAYLDVSETTLLNNSATLMAKEIKEKIFKETQLTASAGVAPNKFLAKIASDWQKPNGLYVITPDQMQDFIIDLPVEKISGVGKVTAEKLHRLGLKTCGDIQKQSEDFIRLHFGKMGHRLIEFSAGVDDREVVTERVRKSLSVENTFPTDLDFYELIKDNHVLSVLGEFIERMKSWSTKNPDSPAPQKCFIKIKYFDFKTITVEQTYKDLSFEQLFDQKQLLTLYLNLLESGKQRRDAKLRLFGLGVRFSNSSTDSEQKQISMNFEDVS